MVSDLTKIISKVQKGDESAAERLLPIVYDELRRLATHRLAQELPGQTLQATALVHEVFLRLTGGGNKSEWKGRSHFFAAAAESMRRILVEAARRKSRLKHGGGRARAEFDQIQVEAPLKSDEVLAVNDALERLESINPDAARLTKLRYFAGYTIREAAELLEMSPRKANQVWAYARAWLLSEISDDE